MSAWILVLWSCGGRPVVPDTTAPPEVSPAPTITPHKTAADEPADAETTEEPAPACAAATSTTKTWKVAPHPAPATPLDVSPGDATVLDYYHHFFSTPFASFRHLDRAAAHAAETYQLFSLDPTAQHLSFGTSHTPLDWDGDAKTEWNYALRVWTPSEDTRIVAVVKTENTWVSNFSTLSFYRHDAAGLHPFDPLPRRWHMSDFVDADLERFFPDSVVVDPPVSVKLTAESVPPAWVEVRLEILNEYSVPEDIWDTFVCLNVEPPPLYFDPTEGKLRHAPG